MKQGKKINQISNDKNYLTLIGRKAIVDVLHDPHLLTKIHKVILTTTQNHLINLCQDHKIDFEFKPKKWFEKTFAKETHQNCCIYIEARQPINLTQLIAKNQNNTKSVILMLDQIQDPHNFGAILRTAVAANVTAIIIPKHNQVKLNTTVLKVSAGTGLLIDIVEVSNLNNALAKLKIAGYWSYAALLNTKAQKYDEIKYAAKSVLIVGNEGNGISHLLAQKTDFIIMIPMANRVESLNVSVATGILVYQMMK